MTSAGVPIQPRMMGVRVVPMRVRAVPESRAKRMALWTALRIFSVSREPK